MKVSQSSRGRMSRAFLPLCFLCFGFCFAGFAQTNSWTNSASGNWENTNWSLGLPAAGQNVFITNARTKTIFIETNTVQSEPDSLVIQSLVIASQNNSSNQLLMNSAGLDVPLQIGGAQRDGSLLIYPNSTFMMLSSALLVNNGPLKSNDLGAFSVGGNFNADAGSEIVAGLLNVGDIGPGVFNLTNSSLFVSGYEAVGGFASTFNQYNGTNHATTLKLNTNGQYNFYGGTFSGQIEFAGGGFSQYGGSNSPILVFQASGNYLLSNGILNLGNFTLDAGGITQTGGTNLASTITMHGGSTNGPGSGYTLSNGVMNCSNLSIGNWQGTNSGQVAGYSFNQFGGVHQCGSLSINGLVGSNGIPVGGSYNLNGGTLQAAIISVNIGSFSQTNGSNSANSIIIGTNATYDFGGGYMTVQSITVAGAFLQSASHNQCSNLVISGTYDLSGGLLTATTVQVTGGAALRQTGGGFYNSGILTLANGTLQESVSVTWLEKLLLGAGTNSMIQFAKPCVLRFADCSGVTWSNASVLTIVGWSGKLTGGGTNQLIFGTNAAGLTSRQLNQVQFANPAGLSPGNYLATILSNGEIVPGLASFLDGAPAPFFSGEAALGNDWYYLAPSNQVFGYYSVQNFPYVYHIDMGWEYFVDADNARHGAYFYDFSDSAYIYTEPGSFPYFYDMHLQAWLYYAPAANAPDRYTSNPRWFYNLSTQSWTNHL